MSLQAATAATSRPDIAPRPPPARDSTRDVTGATPDWPRSQDDYFHLCPRPGSAGRHRVPRRVEPVVRPLTVGRSTGRLVCFSDAKATWLGHLSARGSCGRGRRLRLDDTTSTNTITSAPVAQAPQPSAKAQAQAQRAPTQRRRRARKRRRKPRRNIKRRRPRHAQKRSNRARKAVTPTTKNGEPVGPSRVPQGSDGQLRHLLHIFGRIEVELPMHRCRSSRPARRRRGPVACRTARTRAGAENQTRFGAEEQTEIDAPSSPIRTGMPSCIAAVGRTRSARRARRATHCCS